MLAREEGGNTMTDAEKLQAIRAMARNILEYLRIAPDCELSRENVLNVAESILQIAGNGK